MTSASELFRSWRSRSGGRSPDYGDPVPGPLAADLHHPRLRRRRRHRILHHYHHHEECDPSHRHRPCFRGASPAEHGSICPDHVGSSESGSADSRNVADTSSRVNRLRLNRNAPLPGAVLLARARLVERLRGVSLAGNRQSGATPWISWDEFTVDDDFIIAGWEPTNHIAGFISEANEDSFLQNLNKKKPAGLSREAFLCLQREIFNQAEGKEVVMECLECCICLEKFQNGDSLIRLSCGHQFHCSCLEPWVQACGDCPYCRASIQSCVPGT